MLGGMGNASVRRFGVRAVDYLTAVQYLNALRSICSNRSGDHKVVLVPVKCVNGVDDIVKMNLSGNTRSARRPMF